MRSAMLAAAAMAAIVLAMTAGAAAAMPPAGPAALASAAGPAASFTASYAPPAHKTAVVCGSSGCAPLRPVQYEWGWGRPWGYPYRPACPEGYYFACRDDAYGRTRCACWPY